jgi:hypothetical protein
MKKTNKKNSKMRKLLPAFAMLTVSAISLSSATYAWFTMNKTVTVTGMSMKTKVGANLLISDNNYEADYTTAGLVQTRAALLEPVSSVNATNGSFFYTVNALGNGDAVSDSYTPYHETAGTGESYGTALAQGAFDTISGGGSAGSHPQTSGAGKENYDDEFNATYTITDAAANASSAYTNAYGYVDYVFYLKGTADGTNNNIRMTKCNLVYNNAAITSATNTVGTDVDKAWRAAIFCSDITATAPGNGMQASNATSENLKAILTLDGAENHSDIASGETAGNYAISGESSAPAKMALGYNTWSDETNSAIATLNNKSTGYYMVTVRMWLEGEDTTCTSKTYAQLDNAWSLDCEFSMDSTKSAVTRIGSVAAANNNNNNNNSGNNG